MTVVSLTINGRPATAEIEPRTHLADYLRETQNLTGTHLGCEHGVCGACTVLIDGVPARSCITLAAACENAEVTSIEGLDDDEIAGELRTAFKREHGLQCGYCTPGMIVAARDVVLRLDRPSEHEIRVAMSGNLCRCTGYVGIIRAIESVILDRRARGIVAIPGGGRTALGPAGSGRAGEAAPARGSRTSRAAPSSSAPTVAAELSAGWKPQKSFGQSFTVSHSPDVVWAFFDNIEQVAACLPGASLKGAPVDGRVEGQIRVKLGPIAAEFQGSAEIERDEATQTGRIVGAGKDRRSDSTTRGVVTYAVKSGDTPGTTRVDLSIGYTLTGMLAQFGRSGLVEDVANRLINAFATNLQARLSQGDASQALPVRELNAVSLISSVFLDRLRRIFATLFRSS